MENKSVEFDFKSISFVDEENLIPAELNSEERKEYIIEVDFKGSRKGYYVNAKSVPLKVGDYVIVDCDNGEDMGVVSSLINKSLRQELTEDGEIIHKANQIDIRRLDENRKIEDKILIEARKQAKTFNLDMKFIDIEYKFDRKKLVFYFTADGRVDFRELVKVFAGEYRTRIELRQIGVRDEAQRIGGIGICGRELCCSKFLKSFVSINVAMARDQNLFVKPEKFSGACGKLMCCLKYEHEFYLNAKKGIPEIGTVIKTTKGTWFVTAIDVFKKSITLSSAANDMITYSFEQVDELIKLLSPNSIIAGGNGHGDNHGQNNNSDGKNGEGREGCSTCKDGVCTGGCKISDVDLLAFKKKFEKAETPLEISSEELNEFSLKYSKKNSSPESKPLADTTAKEESVSKTGSRNSSRDQQRDNSNRDRNGGRNTSRENSRDNSNRPERRNPERNNPREQVRENVKAIPAETKSDLQAAAELLPVKEIERIVHRDENRPRKNLNRDPQHPHQHSKPNGDKQTHQNRKPHEFPPRKNLNTERSLPKPENLNEKTGPADLLSRPLKEKRPFEKNRQPKPVEKFVNSNSDKPKNGSNGEE